MEMAKYSADDFNMCTTKVIIDYLPKCALLIIYLVFW